MSVKIIFKQLINLTTNEDYLKKGITELKLISIEEQSLTIEMSSCVINTANSINLYLLIQAEKKSLEIAMTCKVVHHEICGEVNRIELKLIQYNKKEWIAFRNLVAEKQNWTVDLLNNMRGKLSV
jgi:hypothetical protein